jgi:hypothetical protein
MNPRSDVLIDEEVQTLAYEEQERDDLIDIEFLIQERDELIQERDRLERERKDREEGEEGEEGP